MIDQTELCRTRQERVVVLLSSFSLSGSIYNPKHVYVERQIHDENVQTIITSLAARMPVDADLIDACNRSNRHLLEQP